LGGKKWGHARTFLAMRLRSSESESMVHCQGQGFQSVPAEAWLSPLQSHAIEQFDRRLIAREMASRSHGAAQFCVQRFNRICRADAAAGSLRFKKTASTFLDRKIIQETGFRA
jgi:hypothetical protein